MFEWDDDKAARNLTKHGVDFGIVHAFDFAKARVREDTRGDYGEPRFVAVGPIRARLHVLIFTWRDGAIRVISLRKANARERKRYGKA